MANDTAIGMLIVLICFWTLLSIFANYFGVELAYTRIENLASQKVEENKGFFGVIDSVLDFLDSVPLINYFVPLLRIMTFQYTDQVPVMISLLLNAISLITIVVFYEVVKK